MVRLLKQIIEKNNLLNLSSFFWLAIKNVQNFVQKKNGCNGFYKFLCCPFYLQK